MVRVLINHQPVNPAVYHAMRVLTNHQAVNPVVYHVVRAPINHLKVNQAVCHVHPKRHIARHAMLQRVYAKLVQRIMYLAEQVAY